MKERDIVSYEISPGFLIQVFGSGRFSQRVKEVLTKTNIELITSKGKRGRLSVPEFGFLIDRNEGGQNFFIWPVHRGAISSMHSTKIELSLPDFILNRVIVGKNRRLLALIHFHQPWEQPLIPSAYSSEDQKGDLYGLFTQRKSRLLNPSSYLDRKTICVIGKVGHPDYFEYPGEFLFIQEGWVENRLDGEVLERLEFLQNYFLAYGNSLSQEEIVRTLIMYGYNAYHFAISRERWNHPNLFSHEQLRKIGDLSY